MWKIREKSYKVIKYKVGVVRTKFFYSKPKIYHLWDFNEGPFAPCFESVNDFSEYLILGDYLIDFNNFKSVWYHQLHIVLDDFSKLHMVRIIFLRFQCDFLWFLVISVDCILNSERIGSMIWLVNGPSDFKSVFFFKADFGFQLLIIMLLIKNLKKIAQHTMRVIF